MDSREGNGDCGSPTIMPVADRLSTWIPAGVDQRKVPPRHVPDPIATTRRRQRPFTGPVLRPPLSVQSETDFVMQYD
jgi:hypothetical protein